MRRDEEVFDLVDVREPIVGRLTADEDKGWESSQDKTWISYPSCAALDRSLQTFVVSCLPEVSVIADAVPTSPSSSPPIFRGTRFDFFMSDMCDKRDVLGAFQVDLETLNDGTDTTPTSADTQRIAGKQVILFGARRLTGCGVVRGKRSCSCVKRGRR